MAGPQRRRGSRDHLTTLVPLKRRGSMEATMTYDERIKLLATGHPFLSDASRVWCVKCDRRWDRVEYLAAGLECPQCGPPLALWEPSGDADTDSIPF